MLEMNQTGSYLFVYGTLRKDIVSPMSTWLARQAEFVTEGYLQAELYDLDQYPGARLSPQRSSRVTGDVYWLRDPASLLAVLDDYEECSPLYPQPHEYERALVTITLPDRKALSAWTYLYNRPIAGLPRIISGNYLQFLRMRESLQNRTAG